MIYNAREDYVFDAIVVGVGHAGIEAGLALAKCGCKTLMLSISLDNIGYLACNPSIGGTAKGHLVREIDALGGQMGIAADRTLTQLRMLNESKGPAVHSLRAQVDKFKYHFEMKQALENQERLYLKQAEVSELLFNKEGSICGVKTIHTDFYSKAVIIAAGVYLKSTIIIGDIIEEKGPASFLRSEKLSDGLRKIGIELRRFKTGTPARVHRDSIDVSKLQLQEGQADIYSFSVTSKRVNYNKNCCFLGYTNQKTHEIISRNIHKTARYRGLTHGTGARYCPSIEDKIIRFSDKDRHQFFLEPEGEHTKEMYVQGMSTSLPVDVQLEFYRSIEGFENIHIMRDAYAIEYDCIDPRILLPTLMHKEIKGLFFAGQINGTSGYEEAAAQGLVAGINAGLYLRGMPPVIFGRENSYIGVMIDDLVTKGTNEPYRMMTSRAEHRLYLRQDNADLRLTEVGYAVGLVSKNRYRRLRSKLKKLDDCKKLLKKVLPPSTLTALFNEADEVMPISGLTIENIIKRNNITPQLLQKHIDCLKGFKPEVLSQIFIETRYSGYMARQQRARAEQERLSEMTVPSDLDYRNVQGLRMEAIEKFNQIRPMTIAQATGISGITPADINLLIIALKKM